MRGWTVWAATLAVVLLLNGIVSLEARPAPEAVHTAVINGKRRDAIYCPPVLGVSLSGLEAAMR